MGATNELPPVATMTGTATIADPFAVLESVEFLLAATGSS